MTLWDLCALVGTVTLTVLALRGLHFAVESIVVMRLGWDQLEELGFWRSIPAILHRHTRVVVERTEKQ